MGRGSTSVEHALAALPAASPPSSAGHGERGSLDLVRVERVASRRLPSAGRHRAERLRLHLRELGAVAPEVGEVVGEDGLKNLAVAEEEQTCRHQPHHRAPIHLPLRAVHLYPGLGLLLEEEVGVSDLLLQRGGEDGAVEALVDVRDEAEGHGVEHHVREGGTSGKPPAAEDEKTQCDEGARQDHYEEQQPAHGGGEVRDEAGPRSIAGGVLRELQHLARLVAALAGQDVVDLPVDFPKLVQNLERPEEEDDVVECLVRHGDLAHVVHQRVALPDLIVYVTLLVEHLRVEVLVQGLYVADRRLHNVRADVVEKHELNDKVRPHQAGGGDEPHDCARLHLPGAHLNRQVGDLPDEGHEGRPVGVLVEVLLGAADLPTLQSQGGLPCDVVREGIVLLGTFGAGLGAAQDGHGRISSRVRILAFASIRGQVVQHHCQCA
mmetsp:Transcript_17742/g.53397  ORF Transcript_17742/g.53397 Transcript_17742/m.53397 type:complete len:436 (-) Transcript_17742:144-1451(-)